MKHGDLVRRGWLLDVLSCIEKIHAADFTLEQVYAFTNELQVKHPENKHVQAKIRQQLQYLRDQGYIDFTARGRYHKVK